MWFLHWNVFSFVNYSLIHAHLGVLSVFFVLSLNTFFDLGLVRGQLVAENEFMVILKSKVRKLVLRATFRKIP